MSREGYRSGSAALARPNLPGIARGSNPYLFVVGAARSGTTLLQRMLDAHPLLAVVNETYWLPRKYWERAGLTQDGVVTPALFPLLLDSPKFERMGFGESDLRRYSRTSTGFARRSRRTSAATTGPFRGAGDMTARDARAWPWRAT